MSLGLTKPGMRSVNLTGMHHPKTGQLIEPLGFLKNGSPVWPVIGAASDDPDDPAYTGEEDDDEDEEEEEDVKFPASKSKKKVVKDDEDDEEEDDEEDKRPRAIRQAARYRTQLRAEQAKTRDLEERLRAIEDKDKDPDEVTSRTLTELRAKETEQTEIIRVMNAQLAFFKSNQIDWVDASDAFALAERQGLFDDVIDESGNVDARELRRSLRELAKRKPHLVKKQDVDPKARGRKDDDTDDDDEEEDDEDIRRPAGTMNGKRKGTKGTPNRAALAKKFPVLNSF